MKETKRVWTEEELITLVSRGSSNIYIAGPSYHILGSIYSIIPEMMGKPLEKLEHFHVERWMIYDPFKLPAETPKLPQRGDMIIVAEREHELEGSTDTAILLGIIDGFAVCVFPDDEEQFLAGGDYDASTYKYWKIKPTLTAEEISHKLGMSIDQLKKIFA